MTCPTVIRVTTKAGPPGIGLPPGGAQQDGFAIVKDGATPYLYKLVQIDQVGLPQALGVTASPTFAGLTLSGLQAQAQGLAVVGINGQIQRASIGSGLAIQNGALVVTTSGGGSGTVTSVGLSAPAGFSVSGSPVTESGTLSFSFANGYSLPTTAKQQQWDTASGLAATAVQESDARLANSREWSAETISKAEAEEGLSTTRRAFSSLRVRESIIAWWQSTSGTVGKLLAAAGTQADARTALGLGTAATSAASDFATPAALATGLAGKADLVGGVIPSSQIPSIAITDYLGAVNSQSAMLALSGQKGDWCIRTDGLPNTGAWILSGNNPASLSDWVKIPLPDVPVQSVNGQAGNIVLAPSDIGAATAAQGAKADSAIQPGNPALSDAREWSALTIDEAEAAAGTATTRRAFNALRVRQAILGWWQTVTSALGRSLVAAADASAARTVLGLGTAAPLDVATTGNATTSQVVKGDDTRLSDARTPTAHTQAASTITGLATVATTGAYSDLTGRPPEISQADAEAGSATTFSLWSAQRWRQAAAAWWQTVSSAVGRSLVAAADASAARSAISAAGSGAITGSGLTMATARLLGRTTASSGAVEEIQIVGGTFAGGVLTLPSGGGAAARTDYKPGNFISSLDAYTLAGAGMGSTSLVVLRSFVLQASMTIDQLIVRVTTAAAGSTFQLSIYNSSANGDPTGLPLANTASLTGAATGNIAGSITPLPLTANKLYWMAVAADSTTLAFMQGVANSLKQAYLHGAENLSFISTSTLVSFNRTASATYGTWPDLTGVSTSIDTINRGAIQFFRIASVP